VPCDRTFKTLQGLRAHEGQKHAREHPYRAYVAGSDCPVCKTHFFTRARSLEHLRTGKKTCRLAVDSGQIAKLSEEEKAETDKKEREVKNGQRQRGRHYLGGPRSVPFKAVVDE